jgi:exopolyphosphatase/pppGpp-phosphohydrolase
VGRTLGPKQLAKAEAVLSSAPAEELAEEFGFPLWRGQTLLAGALVLAEAQKRLGVPLVVARAGLREGAVLESLAEEQAA